MDKGHVLPSPPPLPQYIEVLRRCKMGARLREARQAMHDVFPLTEQLW